MLFKIVDAQREPKRFQGRLGVTNSATNTGKKFKDYDDFYDDYYDYYYDDEPLPSGPTRRPEISQNSPKFAGCFNNCVNTHPIFVIENC